MVTMDTVLIPLYINLKLKDLSFKIKMVLLFFELVIWFHFFDCF